jgi:hypothetical protein
MRTHTNVSPSRTEIFWNCPGSVALCGKVPARETSVFAKDGIRAHALAEHCLRVKRNPLDFIEEFLLDEKKDEFMVTQEMAEAVQVYYDKILADLHADGLDLSVLDIERRFQLDIDKDAIGTNDAGYCTPSGIVRVYDFKYGAGKKVYALENKQALYYAAGKLQECLGEKVVITIVQPRCKIGEPIETYETTVEEVEKFKLELKDRIAATRRPDAKREPGEHCMFCDAKGICPEYRANALNGSMSLTAKETVSLPVVSTVTDDALLAGFKKFDDFCEKVEALRKELYDRALELAKAGRIAEGYKLVQKEGNRQWIDEAKVVETFKDRLGKDLWKTELISPSQVEKKIKGKGGKDEVNALTIRPLGDVSLVESGYSRGKEIMFNPFPTLDKTEKTNKNEMEEFL